jgi:hypothetical protein
LATVRRLTSRTPAPGFRKPRIRAAAKLGDLVLGFAASSLSRDKRLVYIARVTKVEANGADFENPVYSDRPDRIYVRGDDRRFRIRPTAAFHAHGALLEHDLGTFPEYAKARVIASDDSRTSEARHRALRSSSCRIGRSAGCSGASVKGIA